MRYKLTVVIYADSDKAQSLAERVAAITSQVGVIGASLDPRPLTGKESDEILRGGALVDA